MSELNEAKYRQLKSAVEAAKSEAERAQGSLDQLMTRLEEDHGCKTLKEAKAKLAELEEEATAAERAYIKAISAYEAKWKESDDA